MNKSSLLHEIKNLDIKLNRKPTKRDSPRLNYFARKYFGTWNNTLKEAGFKVKKFQKPIIPEKLTPELSYFLGLLVTDGHIVFNKIGIKTYKILLFTSYEEEHNLISSLIKKIFDYIPSIRQKKYGFNKRYNYEIYISSKLLVEYFIKNFQIPAGAKSNIVRVPEIFFVAKKSNTSAFLRGVIDGDGSVSSKSKCVRITSSSLKFLEDIKKLLLYVNILPGNIIKDKRRNT